MDSPTCCQEVQGEFVQIGHSNRTNNYITNNNYVIYSYPPGQGQQQTAIAAPNDETNSPAKTNKSTQTTDNVCDSVLATQDMDGNDINVGLGDPLQVDYHLEAANAIYIGAGMSVCVRDERIVKERLYLKPFRKRGMKFKLGVDVFTSSCVARRARQRIGELFTEGIHIDFVTWCHTDLKRKQAYLQDYHTCI